MSKPKRLREELERWFCDGDEWDEDSGMTEWEAHWNSLTPAEQARERRMMDEMEPSEESIAIRGAEQARHRRDALWNELLETVYEHSLSVTLDNRYDV